MSIELTYLIFAIFLVLIQLIFQVGAGYLANGLTGLAGSRDDEVLATGVGGRFERAYYNMLETFPVFAALVLIIQVTESWSTTSALGVQLYFWARVAYIHGCCWRGCDRLGIGFCMGAFGRRSAGGGISRHYSWGHG